MTELRFGTVTEVRADGKAKVECGAGLPRTAFLPVLASAGTIAVGDRVAVLMDGAGTGDGIVAGTLSDGTQTSD